MHTVCIWVHVRNERVIGSVSRFEEESHSGLSDIISGLIELEMEEGSYDKADHGLSIVAVYDTYYDKEDTCHDCENVDQHFLGPDTFLAANSSV